jgi:hypothetical protein
MSTFSKFQEITSAKTSVNQISSTFKKIIFKEGNVNLDFGGGKYDKATKFLEDLGVSNLVYDPFNRSISHNLAIRYEVFKKSGADTVTVNNVLNVVKEIEVIKDIIFQSSFGVKDGGEVYFLIYEGNKTGVGVETVCGFQRNQRASDYMDYIKEYFGDVVRRGNLIIAKRPFKSNKELSIFNLDNIKNDLDKEIRRIGAPIKSKKYGVGKQMGDFVYFHKSMRGLIDQEHLNNALSLIPSDFKYDVIKFNVKSGVISFIESKDFDTADEPTVGKSYCVDFNAKKVSVTKEKVDPQIYHHKWLFVLDNYRKFDVVESKIRTISWYTMENIEKSKIGAISYWQKNGPAMKKIKMS